MYLLKTSFSKDVGNVGNTGLADIKSNISLTVRLLIRSIVDAGIFVPLCVASSTRLSINFLISKQLLYVTP